MVIYVYRKSEKKGLRRGTNSFNRVVIIALPLVGLLPNAVERTESNMDMVSTKPQTETLFSRRGSGLLDVPTLVKSESNLITPPT